MGLQLNDLIFMNTLESRLQKRIYVWLYALLFLAALLGLSVLLEGRTAKNREVTFENSNIVYSIYTPMSKGFIV
jgi:hypothetical protein